MFNRIKSQPLGLSLSPFGFSCKCNAAGAQIFGDVFGGLAGMWSTDQANQTNKQIADNQYWYTKDLNKENRDWQSEENMQARQWQEEMYNLYNSPSAMMRQYREAGLNPYMVGQGGVGSGGSAPTSPAMSGSPSAGGVSMGHPAMPYDMSFIGDSVSDYMRVKSIDASVADQRQQAISRGLDNFTKALERGLDFEDASNILQMSIGSFKRDETMDYALLSIQENYLNQQAIRKLNQFNYFIQSKYGEKTAQNVQANQEQEFNKMAAEIRKMASDARVNEADISLKAAQMAKEYAEANHLKADTETINAIRDSVATIYEKDSLLKSYEEGEESSEFENRSTFRKWKRTPDAIERRKATEMVNGEFNRRRASIKQNVGAIRGGVNFGSSTSVSTRY